VSIIIINIITFFHPPRGSESNVVLHHIATQKREVERGSFKKVFRICKPWLGSCIILQKNRVWLRWENGGISTSEKKNWLYTKRESPFENLFNTFSLKYNMVHIIFLSNRPKHFSFIQSKIVQLSIFPEVNPRFSVQPYKQSRTSQPRKIRASSKKIHKKIGEAELIIMA